MICKFQHDGMCCNCGSLHYQRICMERNCPHIAPITNADHIRSMTDEELAKMLWKTGRNYRAICADPVVDFKEHSAELMDWLKQPYKEET